MHRETGVPTLFDTVIPEMVGRNETLERLDSAMDWERIGALVSELHSSRRGRPSYPPLTMVKVLLLQQWYGVSDVEAESVLKDRISFMRFVGLGMSDGGPDHSTISRFRGELTDRGLVEGLFNEVNRQLEQLGLTMKRGTMVDATLIEAAVRRPSGDTGTRSARDPDASWSGRGERSRFGYKMHLGVDSETGLVRRATMTSANVNETEVADGLLSGDERAVYGDRRTARRRAASVCELRVSKTGS